MNERNHRVRPAPEEPAPPPQNPSDHVSSSHRIHDEKVKGAASELIGRVIGGRFRILDPIARGGMGMVFRAEQVELRRPVALKILDQRTPSDDRGNFKQRFELEAAMVARLMHPNVVVVHDYGHEPDGLYYIAMELVVGRTLRTDVREAGPMPGTRLVHIALQTCSALREAHDNQVIHRDLKPSNILLTRRGSDEDFVKVVDFGLIKMLADDAQPLEFRDSTEVTQDGIVLGSPSYIAPEQALGHTIGPPTDVYSFGAVMFYMATGRPPFKRKSDFATVSAHLSDPPPTLREAFPDCQIGPDLERVIHRCLEKNPAHRYASMLELADALAGTSESSISSTGAMPYLGLSGSHAIPTVDEVAPPKRPSRRAAMALLVAVPIVFAGVALLIPARQSEETATVEPEVAVAPPPAPTEAAPESGPVALSTEPPGALVRRGRARLGRTPITLRIPTGQAWVLTIEKEGFLRRQLMVQGGASDRLINLAAVPSPSPAPPPAPTANHRRHPSRHRRLRHRHHRHTKAPPAPAPEPTATAPPEPEAPPPQAPEPEAVPRSRTDNLDPWSD